MYFEKTKRRVFFLLLRHLKNTHFMGHCFNGLYSNYSRAIVRILT